MHRPPKENGGPGHSTMIRVYHGGIRARRYRRVAEPSLTVPWAVGSLLVPCKISEAGSFKYDRVRVRVDMLGQLLY
eukprot:758699-Hanusia_phi.AAC.4